MPVRSRGVFRSWRPALILGLAVVGLVLLFCPACWGVLLMLAVLDPEPWDVFGELGNLLLVVATTAALVVPLTRRLRNRRFAALWGGWPLGASLGFVWLSVLAFALETVGWWPFIDWDETLHTAVAVGLAFGAPMGGTIGAIHFLIRRQRKPEAFGEDRPLDRFMLGFNVARIVLLNLAALWILTTFLPM